LLLEPVLTGDQNRPSSEQNRPDGRFANYASE